MNTIYSIFTPMSLMDWEIIEMLFHSNAIQISRLAAVTIVYFLYEICCRLEIAICSRPRNSAFTMAEYIRHTSVSKTVTIFSCLSLFRVNRDNRNVASYYNQTNTWQTSPASSKFIIAFARKMVRVQMTWPFSLVTCLLNSSFKQPYFHITR